MNITSAPQLANAGLGYEGRRTAEEDLAPPAPEAASPASGTIIARPDLAPVVALPGTAPETDLGAKMAYDTASGRVVVRIVDRKTGDVVRQSPPDSLLRLFAVTREQSHRVQADV